MLRHGGTSLKSERESSALQVQSEWYKEGSTDVEEISGRLKQERGNKHLRYCNS
jgi:hypothetical protein